MTVVVQGGKDFAHGISFEFKSVGVVDEAVKDQIGEGGVGDAGVPVLDRDLGGDQGCGAAVTVVEDLEQVFGLGAGERVSTRKSIPPDASQSQYSRLGSGPVRGM